MGTSLLIEETGTTDFGGVLLRYYAAEGLVQGHQVHLLGFGDAWRRELPGLGNPESSKKTKSTASSEDKMKIAWRYETLGQRNIPARGIVPHDSTRILQVSANESFRCPRINKPYPDTKHLLSWL
jgi:elongator complex protein 4